jgi:type I restriction enzyme S subunit
LKVDVTKQSQEIGKDATVLICGPLLRPEFLRVCLTSKTIPLLRRSTAASHGMRSLPYQALRNLPVPCPPLGVQDEIVAALQQRSADIDAVIAAKRAVLGYLAEQRKSIIFNAATGGITEPGALRPSGLAWLAEIPAHWEIRKLSHLGRICMGATPPRDRSQYWAGGTVPWLTSTVVNEWEVTEASEYVTEDAVDDYHLPRLGPGTVLIATAGTGRTRGQATVLATTATINQNIIAIEPERSLADPWYLCWVLTAAYDYLRGISDHSGSITGALRMPDISNFRIPFPPFEEQHMISRHITRNVENLDTLSSVTQRTVALLAELQGALNAMGFRCLTGCE